jgi:hypothetical protein
VENEAPHIWGGSWKTPSRNRRLAELAARQYGLVRVAQLHALGLDQRAISRWTRDGRLHRLYRGVYAVGHAGLSREGAWLAGVFASGEGAGLSGPSSESLWEISRKPATGIHVVVPRKRRAQEGVELLISRTLQAHDIVVYRGIPVTHVARTLVDLTEHRTPHQLANTIYEAAYRNRFNLRATRQTMQRAHGRHKLAVLERALELNASGSAGTKSDLEDAFLALLSAGGFPEPLVNTHVQSEEADCFWPDRRLIAEVDGPGHLRPRAKRNDARKEAIWRVAGYEVLRFTDVVIEQQPDHVVRVLSAWL